MVRCPLLSNGVRLSCAARVCLSQMQFYYNGRRQLQPLVRLRTHNRRSDPSWDRRDRSTHRTRPLHRGRDAGRDDARIHREAAPPAAYEIFIRKELQRTRTHPSDFTLSRGLTTWGSLENSLCRFAWMRSLTGCA